MTNTIRYTRSGDLNIAYQVVGDGPRDIILVPGWISHIEVFWEEPSVARFFERLASFSRLILFDKRGTGLSDRFSGAPDLETRMDDVRAVMDAVGSEKATLLGYSEGGAMSMLFAATYPERVTSLVMCGCFPRLGAAEDWPYGRPPEVQESIYKACTAEWGTPVACDTRCPSKIGDERYRQWWARWLRMSATSSVANEINRMNYNIDVRNLLGSIRVPTLLLHSVGDRAIDVGASRYMAERIPGAKLVEFPGSDHMMWLSDAEGILDETEQFLTGTRSAVDVDRVLVTVMFTDIVGSTEQAVALGDHAWRDLLQAHHAKVRSELARFRGKEIDTAGDGFLATFDGPARAVRCARAISEAVRPLGIEIRAGLHTGECEVMGEGIGGLAVHIGSRIVGLAGAGEVMVSSTVKDLVAGSGLSFEDRGRRQLKGVPGEWATYAVVG